MTDKLNSVTSRTDSDRYTIPLEPSPSAGYRETAEAMHASEGIDHEACDVTGCNRDGDPIEVIGEDGYSCGGFRCPGHAKDFLEVSS